jgi:hypothetical protein
MKRGCHYKVWVLAMLMGFICPFAFAGDVTSAGAMGAGIGATTGGTTITSTSPQQDNTSHMSGAANIGNATAEDGVVTSTSPLRGGMVASDTMHQGRNSP